MLLTRSLLSGVSSIKLWDDSNFTVVNGTAPLNFTDDGANYGDEFIQALVEVAPAVYFERVDS